MTSSQLSKENPLPMRYQFLLSLVDSFFTLGNIDIETITLLPSIKSILILPLCGKDTDFIRGTTFQ